MTKTALAMELLKANPDMTHKDMIAAFKKRKRLPCTGSLFYGAKNKLRLEAAEELNGAPEDEPKQEADERPTRRRRKLPLTKAGGADSVTVAELILYSNVEETLGGPARMQRVRRHYETLLKRKSQQ